jgi:hypothetical protein
VAPQGPSTPRHGSTAAPQQLQCHRPPRDAHHGGVEDQVLHLGTGKGRKQGNCYEKHFKNGDLSINDGDLNLNLSINDDFRSKMVI